MVAVNTAAEAPASAVVAAEPVVPAVVAAHPAKRAVLAAYADCPVCVRV